MTEKSKTEKPQTQSERNALVAHGVVNTSSTARLRVRKIRHSPVTDPKKLEAARLSAQKLKLKRRPADQNADGPDPGGDSLDDLEVPLITPGL